MPSVAAATALTDPASIGVALLLLIAGSVLLGLPMIKRWRARHAAPLAPRPASIEDRVATLHAAAKERDELSRLIDEAREVIRLGCAQLDSRLERIERLHHEPLADRAAPSTPRAELRSRAARPSATPSPAEPSVDPLARDIYALADAGHSAVEIASQLQEHAGKVELMLALRRV